MSENSTSRPAILIDIKKHRIRIHKYTLHAIGEPNNILLLVNPEERTLAIMSCDHSDPRAHHVSNAYALNKKTFELYSTSLIQNLCAVCSGWTNNSSYRMYGDIIQNEGIIRFHMADSVPVNGAR
jgi:hypothetical protein